MVLLARESAAIVIQVRCVRTGCIARAPHTWMMQRLRYVIGCVWCTATVRHPCVWRVSVTCV